MNPSGRPPDNVQDRILRLSEPEPNTGCWLWLGDRNSRSGRPHLRVIQSGQSRRRMQYAHRVAYQAFVGPILVGQRVRHQCDTIQCVNPAHLRLGTQADNVRDMDERGRRVVGVSCGETHGNARLTAAQVAEMRARFAVGESAALLGEIFGITPSHAWRIVTGRAWARA